MPNGTAVMAKVKDCKHSVPFKTDNDKAPISTVYVSKNHKLASEQQVVCEWDDTSFTVKGI